jgi:hypothetical protein
MFESCKNAKETREELVNVIKSSRLETVQKKIAEKFYNVDDIVEFLYNAIIAGGNGVLYGPGGFGKTEITVAFFNYYGIEPLVVVGHTGTDVEALLGIPNIKRLMDDSTYEVAFENSIFSKPGVLIFEEFMDVKPGVAAALKDIITSGGYRRGDEFIPSKIGSMFICSNKSPDEVTIDLSTAAFYKERFPYSKYVIWNDYSSKEYLNLFKLVYENQFNEEESSFRLIAELCASSCTSDSIISPRMAFNALNLFLINKDIRMLNMVAAINTNRLDEIQQKLRLEKQYKDLNSRFLKLIDIISKLVLKDIHEILAFNAKAKQIAKWIGESNIEGDELLNTASTLLQLIKIKLDEIHVDIMYHGMNQSLKEFDPIYEDIREHLS